MSDDEALPNGYGAKTVPGDNLFNDFIQGEAVSAIVLAEARGERTYRDPGRLAMTDAASALPFSNLIVIESPPGADIEPLVAEIRHSSAAIPADPVCSRVSSRFPISPHTVGR